MRRFVTTFVKGSATLAAITIGYKCYGNLPNYHLSAKEQPIYTLEHVQVVFRHGARTPVASFDLPGVASAYWDPEKFSRGLPYTNVDYKLFLIGHDEEVQLENIVPANFHKELNGGMRRGHLTDVGRQQAYEVGKRLRNEYVEKRKFISSSFNKDEVYIRTSAFQRTIDTVRSLMTGLHGKENIKEPLSLFTVLPQDEYLYPNFHNCKNLKAWFRHLQPNMLTCLPGIEEDSVLINQLLGINEKKDMINMFHVLDLVHTRGAHGFSVKPPNLKREHYDLIERRAAQLFAHAIQGKNKQSDAGLRQSIGTLIEELCTNIEEKVNNENSVKINVFSGHDTTLMGLLLAVGHWKDQWPRYVDVFTIELYKDQNDKRFVRILYNEKTLCIDENKEEEMISLQRFQTLMERYRVKDYHLECQK